MPAELVRRMNRTMRRLGSDFPLAYCVRHALRLANANPWALRQIEGPFDYQLTTVTCDAHQLAQARRSSVRVFGKKRGAYSCYVRAAIDAFIRFAESDQIEVLSGSGGSLSAALLPQFSVSESMYSRMQKYLADHPEQSYGRFVRQALRYALRYPARLPESVDGPFVQFCYAVTADADLASKVRRRTRKNPQQYMRKAMALWLGTIAA